MFDMFALKPQPVDLLPNYSTLFYTLLLLLLLLIILFLSFLFFLFRDKQAYGALLNCLPVVHIRG